MDRLGGGLNEAACKSFVKVVDMTDVFQLNIELLLFVTDKDLDGFACESCLKGLGIEAWLAKDKWLDVSTDESAGKYKCMPCLR